MAFSFLLILGHEDRQHVGIGASVVLAELADPFDDVQRCLYADLAFGLLFQLVFNGTLGVSDQDRRRVKITHLFTTALMDCF